MPDQPDEPASTLTAENVDKLQQHDAPWRKQSGITASTFSSSPPSGLRESSLVHQLPAALLSQQAQADAPGQQLMHTDESITISGASKDAAPASQPQIAAQDNAGLGQLPPGPQIVGPFGGPLGGSVPLLLGRKPAGW